MTVEVALFPKDDIRPEEETLRRRALTQEVGTRKLITAFALVLIVGLIGWRVNDYVLQRKVWPPLAAEPSGLTVVGTLDKRGAYDTNLFKIVQSEGQARAELTDYGWEGIFSGHHGSLTGKGVGDAIRTAISVDDETGYAMLTPILAAEVQYEMGNSAAFDSIRI